MKKLLEENPDDFLNYLKECKEKHYENKGQTIKEFLETGIMYDHNLKAIDENNVEDVEDFFRVRKMKGIAIDILKCEKGDDYE